MFFADFKNICSDTNSQNSQSVDSSQLQHVEIVGTGYGHNMSTAALNFVYRTPTLDSVNVTNSSFHGLTVLAPRERVRFGEMSNVFKSNACSGVTSEVKRQPQPWPRHEHHGVELSRR